MSWTVLRVAVKTSASRPVRGRGAGSGDQAAALPLVLHVHGGGFVGTAVQSDWINSHLAARLPALVVSVEHRLLAPDTPLQRTGSVPEGTASLCTSRGWGTVRVGLWACSVTEG
ncbi:alpha/beta hydrolase fold domain-containing protein [Streptomyces goshikiensis]|uniref:alpha/beta hydrolase fold domain-containing protein n=1 Tax=Streptomyces goshikiensis TaxID=1942 RepID=UPI0036BFC453